jgi:putative transposase
MHMMDKHYLEYPEKGAGRMHTWLTMDKNYPVSKNRIERLCKLMGLRSILPGPHTSKRCKDHKVYPYLLRNLAIERPNQVWATDVTYIPMAKGFLYLTAIIDIYSRYVVHWSVSNTMEADWCARLLEQAVEKHGRPEIINTDQGSQYTADAYTEMVHSLGIKLSMDGKGRATDNAHIERLWRSVKYEKVYPNPVHDGVALHKQLKGYFHYYNDKRRHSGINNQMPKHFYEATKAMAA